MHYDIGIVLYTPSITRYLTDPYELGDTVPLAITFSANNDSIVYWVENEIIGLKVGDPVAFNITTNKMFRIEVVEGLGVRTIGLDF